MTNNYAILVSLGFSKEDYKFENFKSNFGYDQTKEDLEEALECAALNSHNVRNCLMEILWLKVVYEYVDSKGCDREQLIAILTAHLIHTFISTEQRLTLKKILKNLLIMSNQL